MEAAVYNLPRLRGPIDLLVVLIAVMAPAFAAIVLWGGRAHRARG